MEKLKCKCCIESKMRQLEKITPQIFEKSFTNLLRTSPNRLLYFLFLNSYFRNAKYMSNIFSGHVKFLTNSAINSKNLSTFSFVKYWSNSL